MSISIEEKLNRAFKPLTRKRKKVNRKKKPESFYSTNVDFFLARNKPDN